MTSPVESHDPGAFSLRFAEALSARRMTLSRLRDRLKENGNPVSVSTLSYWSSGDRKPAGANSMAVVADIENILGLEDAALSSLIPRSSRGGNVAEPAYTDGVEPIAGTIDELAKKLLTDPFYCGREVSTHITAEVGSDGRVVRQTVRSRVQAVTAPVTEFVWAEVPPHPSGIPPVFTALAGCRLTQTQSEPGGNGFAALFALDRTVPVRHTTMVEFQMDFPSAYPRVAACEHLTARKTREIVLWARFAPDALPAWVEESQVVDGVTTRVVRQLEGTNVHAERTDCGPVLLSLYWGFDA